MGNYDFSRQGVPIASCVANFSGFGSDCRELKKSSRIGGFSQICGKAGGIVSRLRAVRDVAASALRALSKEVESEAKKRLGGFFCKALSQKKFSCYHWGTNCSVRNPW